MCMRPDHKGEMSGRLKSNRQLPYTMHQRPDYSCQMSGRFILNCDSFLTEIRVRMVYHIVRTVDWSFPFLELGKNQWTIRELIGVRTCCWNVRTEASWHRSFSIQCRCPDGRSTSSGQMMLDWLCPDGMARSSGRLTGNFEILLTSLWTVESLFAASLHISDFVQTQNEAKILTGILIRLVIKTS
jgi:hypothetical protein